MCWNVFIFDRRLAFCRRRTIASGVRSGDWTGTDWLRGHSIGTTPIPICCLRERMPEVERTPMVQEALGRMIGDDALGRDLAARLGCLRHVDLVALAHRQAKFLRSWTERRPVHRPAIADAGFTFARSYLMSRIRLALLRGVCQTPAYIAYELGYFREEGVVVSVEIQPTAWVVPERLARQEVQFAVIPWTRVAAASSHGEDLVLVCGSGCEEAALVVRADMEPHEVQRIAVPQEGGIKDLTAMALLQSLGWNERQLIRLPSGDGAILSFVGQRGRRRLDGRTVCDHVGDARTGTGRAPHRRHLARRTGL